MKIILRSLYAVAFVGYVISVAFFLRHMSQNTVRTITPPKEMTPKVTSLPRVKDEPGIPSQLVIADIGVNAPVASAGLTPDGAMDIQKNPDQVTWYKLGPKPGSIGSAVIAGHYGWENGKGSVFNNLHTLKVGDIIVVNDEKGAAISFVVRDTRSYDPAADASAVFLSHDGKAHLNLITCEGVWNSIKQTYSNRLVVFTDRR